MKFTKTKTKKQVFILKYELWCESIEHARYFRLQENPESRINPEEVHGRCEGELSQLLHQLQLISLKILH